ncbi:arylesterase [Maritimibacter alkaliphilus]|uniref:arylesterase n=1 Tax=Maritimibacter alkaliphilus TaxID=404236 RepID=UPI0039658B9C
MSLGLCLILSPLSAHEAQAEVTILALGDSLTQGYGLPPEEGFVPQLQGWLRDQGAEVTVINGGVSGDTTAGGLSRVEWSLTPEVDAMIVELGGNDLLRGIDPAVTRANIEGILKVGQARDLPMMLVGFQAARNYGDGYKRDFDALYPELAEAYGAILIPSFFAGLSEEADPAAYAPYMQADGIHPTGEGVARIVDRIGPQVQALIERVE